MTRVHKISEHEVQASFFRWAEAAVGYPGMEPLCLMYAVPNAARRSVTVASTMKAEGLKSGVPDVVLPWSNGAWHGLYMEFKTEGEKTKPKQDWWLQSLAIAGNLPAVVWDVDSAIKVVEDYLGGRLLYVPLSPGYILQAKARKYTLVGVQVPDLRVQIQNLKRLEAEEELKKLKGKWAKKVLTR